MSEHKESRLEVAKGWGGGGKRKGDENVLHLVVMVAQLCRDEFYGMGFKSQ